jgi:hypothetical protein
MLRVVKIPKKPKVEVRNDNSSPRTDSGWYESCCELVGMWCKGKFCWELVENSLWTGWKLVWTGWKLVWTGWKLIVNWLKTSWELVENSLWTGWKLVWTGWKLIVNWLGTVGKRSKSGQSPM